MADSPSFAFTPEAHGRRQPSLHDDSEEEDWHFRNGPSPIAPRFEQEETKSADRSHDFAQSHFRRRNRLETRLEELQKDVASLTLKLRANSSHNASLDASSFLDERVTSKRVTPNAPERKKRVSADVKDPVATGRLGGQSSAVRALRELHQVTTERDQLKFELERTKRALAAAEKKAKDALRAKKAYDKLKAHCDSLQESLDLSERIRVRQKKLLQQLQLQQRHWADRKEDSRPAKKRPTSARAAGQRSALRRPATPSKKRQAEQEDGALDHTGYDILDSLVTSSHHLEEDEEEKEDAGLTTQEQSPSEPTAASRSRTPRSVPKAAANRVRSDFDSLLQVEPPQFSTRRPSRIATTASRRPSQPQVQQREAMRQAAKWAQRRATPGDVSVATTRVTRRSPTARPKNSFLAPTQASLRRLHDLPRRGDLNRPPFVV